MKNERDNKRLLLLIIAILFIANVLTLVMLFMHRPDKRQGGRHNEKLAMYLKQDLGFNDSQMVRYNQLSAGHKSNIENTMKSMKAQKEYSFKNLSQQGFNDSAISKAASQAAQMQEQIEIKMLQHLKEVRAIGTPAQQNKFDTGFVRRMSRGRGKK
ncbi:MAG: periplasmic heavy metal sensor [Ferruginibacter sp.]